MQKKLVLNLAALLLCSFVFAQNNNSTIKEYKKTFTTYPYSDPDPIPPVQRIYPYFRFDGFTSTPVQKDWKVVELENDYIRVMILPEVGGKIWAATEKATGKDFIYYNHVVKFRDVAMRGPWTSGGIEANYGIIGHTPNCAAPVEYKTTENDDGSVSCIIGWLDLLTRTNWRIEINLPKNKGYFTTKSYWHNSNGVEQPYYHWMNVGIKTKGNLEYIYPGTRYIGHEGEYADWPYNKTQKKQINFYEQNNFGTYKSYHVFGKYADFFGAYWHDDDYGMARYGTHDDKAGKKIWIWGLSQQGMIWDKLLTDNDGQYSEIQSGRLFNQNAEGSTLTPFKHVDFEPFATDEWTEYWYPVMHTKGFVKANEYGALNVRYENGWLKVAFCPAQATDDELLIKDGSKNIYSKKLQLKPLETFSDSVKVEANANSLVASLGGNKLQWSSEPSDGNLARPVDAPQNFDWNSAYGLYVAGKEYYDQRLYAQAEEKLTSSVQLDSNFIPSLTKLAALMYTNMRYNDALTLSRRALSIDTHDGAANYYYGLANAALRKYTDAKDGFDLATLSPAYRCAAYAELSSIYLKELNYEKTLLYAEKSLQFNTMNTAARELKCIAYRKLNDAANAKQEIENILTYDPLNQFVLFEKYLWSNDPKDKDNFAASIRSETPYQTYLELAMDYYDLNLLNEADRVLGLSPDAAMIDYWHDYIAYQLGKGYGSEIKKASAMSPAFVLPFRSEDERMLRWLITKTDDWKPRYYLALLMNNRNRKDDASELFNSLGDKPDAALFYAARASFYPVSKAAQEKDLLTAVELDNNEWRYKRSLAQYYLDNGDITKALIITTAYYNAKPNDYIMGMLHAKCLSANKQFKESESVLSKLTIIPFEGATDGHALYYEASIMQAIEDYKKGSFKTALQHINTAKQWPDNLGVGKPYDEDIDGRAEDYLQALCLTSMKKNAEAGQLFQKVANDNRTGLNDANTVIRALALQKINQPQQADALIEKKISETRNENLKQWLGRVYKGKGSVDAPAKNTQMKIVENIAALK